MTTGDIRKYPRIAFLKLFRQPLGLRLFRNSSLFPLNREETAVEKLLIVAPLSFIL
jgi:hypothetical protein